MTEKETTDLRERIYKLLRSKSSRKLSIIIDKLMNYKSNNVEEAVKEVVQLAKDNKIKIYESKDGFKYLITEENGTDQEKTKE